MYSVLIAHTQFPAVTARQVVAAEPTTRTFAIVARAVASVCGICREAAQAA